MVVLQEHQAILSQLQTDFLDSALTASHGNLVSYRSTLCCLAGAYTLGKWWVQVSKPVANTCGMRHLNTTFCVHVARRLWQSRSGLRVVEGEIGACPIAAGRLVLIHACCNRHSQHCSNALINLIRGLGALAKQT
jgi:hypothetical protein